MNTKKIFLITLLLFSASLYSQIIIEKPSYDIRNSAIPEVRNVTLYKDSTVLDVRFNYIPGWWIKLDSIPVIKCDGESISSEKISGVTLGQKETMPKCGFVDSKITFGPLSSESKKIDFYMSETFSIYGIDISGQKKVSDDLLMPSLYHGVWKRFSENNNFDESKKRYREIGLFKDVAIVGDEMWRYKMIRNRKNESDIVLSNIKSNEEITLYICTCKDGSLKIGRDKKDALSYVKELTDDITQQLFPEFTVDNFFNKGKSTLKGYISGYNENAHDKVMQATHISVFNKSIVNLYAVNIEESGYFEIDIPVDFLSMVSLSIGGSYINGVCLEAGKNVCFLADWESILQSKVKRSNWTNVSFVSDSYLGILNDEYNLVNSKISDLNYKFIKESITKYPLEQYVSKTDSVYNQYAVDLQRVCDGNNISLTTRKILDYEFTCKMLCQKIEYTKSENRFSADNMSGDIHDSYFTFLKNYDFNDMLYMVPTPYFNLINCINYSGLGQADLRSQYLSDSTKVLYEISDFRSLRYKFKKMQLEEAVLLKDKLIENASLPIISSYIEDAFKQCFLSKQNTVIPMKDCKGKEVFKSMLSPHKGKFVCVDFWSIFCGPCVRSIKESAGLREEYKDKVSFVYITNDEHSEKHENLMKDVDGFKYYISCDDMNLFRELFNFLGIPRYVLLNSEGDVIDDNLNLSNLKQYLTM